MLINAPKGIKWKDAIVTEGGIVLGAKWETSWPRVDQVQG